MEKYLDRLNKKQLEACMDTEGPSLIIAGAGSGKTRVLTTRISYLINNCHVDPFSILAITFTNKAAKEMNDRLFQEIGDLAKCVTCKTFHSFGALFLRNEIDVLKNRKRSFQILDDDDSENLIKQAMTNVNIDTKMFKPKMMAGYISQLKSKIKFIDQFESQTKNEVVLTLDEYNRLLIKDNLLDFDDLMLLPVEILNNYPDILDRYQERFKYILVDEFQDSSNIQYEFVSLLASKYGNIFIVGDEDQSIYSFRGANIGNIKKFMADFPMHHKHVLDQNYRSTKSILTAANSLIENNIERIKKDLWTDKEVDGDVSLTKFDTDRDEARSVVAQIKRGVMYGKYQFKDYAIIYRNNYLTRLFENELIINKVPYRVYSGLSFYKRSEVKDMMSYLRLVLNPDDFYSFKRVINIPKRGIGKTTITKIEELIELNNGSIITTVKSPELNLSKKDEIIKFFDIIYELNNKLDTLELKDFFYEVFSKTGYEKYLMELDEEDKADAKIQNVNELLRAISEAQAVGSIKETLNDFLQNVSLIAELDIEFSDPNHVSLITMHSAKGLEFKNVFAVCLEQDIIPGNKCFVDSDFEEERRLLYVCLTRAMDNLYMSYTTSRYQYGGSVYSMPSRFLREIKLPEKKVEKSTSTATVQKIVKSGEFKTNDLVKHEMYGNGKVLAQVENFYIIKFENSPTPKKVIVGHPFLKRL